MYSGIKKLLMISLAGNFSVICISPAQGAPRVLAQSTASSKIESTEKFPSSPTPALAPAKPNEETCLKLFNKFVPSLKELWSKRPKDLRIESTDGYSFIEDMTADHCKSEDTRQEFIALLSKILNTHTGRVGIILPIGPQSHLKHVLAAFEARARQDNLDPKKFLVLIDNNNRPEKTTQAVSSLIFEHKVSAIIGGTEPADAAILRLWAPRLMIPTFIMMEPPTSAPTPFVFYSYPSQKVLAEGAIQANLRFGHKRVSILTPSHQRSSRFIAHYVDAAKKNDINVIHQVIYDPKRFDLMESAARKIFRLDPSERRDDLKKLYETAKLHSQETGEPFNPKMIALAPDIQQDAVLIPDNFKIVRHFAKIFGYLGVRRMPLFGHHEWRSKGLLNPWDSFLSGSYFVDLQGSYQSLPAPIRINTVDSPNLLPPDKVEQADFSLLAWKAIDAPLHLAQRKSEMRRKLDRFVPRAKEPSNSAVNQAAAVTYNQDNNINWDASIFSISSKSASAGVLTLIGP
jgi:hypothetical protein